MFTVRISKSSICTPFSFRPLKSCMRWATVLLRSVVVSLRLFIFEKIGEFSRRQFIFSTGMCTFEEITETVEFLVEILTLL